MRSIELDVIPEPNSNEKPFFTPDSLPAVSGEDADVEYLCGDCGVVLAELPFGCTLADVMNKREEAQGLDDIHVLRCPDCGSFNEFPHNVDDMENSSSPDLDENLKLLLNRSRNPDIDDHEPEGHFLDPDTHLLDRWDDIYEFDYEDLLRFPRYLSDAMFMTSPPRITYDHFVYWGWTAAYIVEHPLSEEEPYKEMIEEYLSLVHFMIFKLRYIYSRLFYRRDGFSTEIDDKEVSWRDAWSVIEWENPSVQHLSVLPDRYAATTGFAILDGLICVHSDELSRKTGNAVGEIRSLWRPNNKSLNGVNYHDKLQTWRFYSARPRTEQTLEKINDLSRYEIDILLSNMAGIEDIIETEKKETGHFLRVVADQRDGNLHGQQNNRVVGTLLTTLCSLLIWDAIPEEDFEEHREEVLDIIEEKGDEGVTDVLKAPAFMPVDRVAHLTDLDILRPSDPRYPEDHRSFDYE